MMLGGCPLNPGSQAGWQPGSEGVKLMGLVGIFFFFPPSSVICSKQSLGGRSELSKGLLLGEPGVVWLFPSWVPCPVPPCCVGLLCARAPPPPPPWGMTSTGWTCRAGGPTASAGTVASSSSSTILPGSSHGVGAATGMGFKLGCGGSRVHGWRGSGA